MITRARAVLSSTAAALVVVGVVAGGSLFTSRTAHHPGGPAPPAPVTGRAGEVVVADDDGLHRVAVNLTDDGPTTIDVEKIPTPGRPISPSVTKDGARIVYATPTGATTDLEISDGSQPVRLTDTPEISETGPVWSPDGSRLAYEQTGADGKPSIVISDPETGSITRVESGLPISINPTWSSDGSTLAFVGRDDRGDTDLYAYDVQSAMTTRLTSSPDVAESAPSYAPGSDRIAFLVRETTAAGTEAGADPAMPMGVGWALFTVSADRAPERVTGPDQFFKPQWVDDDLVAMVVAAAPGSEVTFIDLTEPDRRYPAYDAAGLATFSWRTTS